MKSTEIAWDGSDVKSDSIVISDGSDVELYQLRPCSKSSEGFKGYAAKSGERSEDEIFKVERNGKSCGFRCTE